MLKDWREQVEGHLSLEKESVGRKINPSTSTSTSTSARASGKGNFVEENQVEIQDLDRKRGVDIDSQKVVGPSVNGNGI